MLNLPVNVTMHIYIIKPNAARLAQTLTLFRETLSGGNLSPSSRNPSHRASFPPTPSSPNPHPTSFPSLPLAVIQMRVNKQKRHRKAVKFFTACFRFRPPFKILCDGTFVHHLVTYKISPEKALSTILSDTVKIFTTRCVLTELKRLGKSYAESFSTAKNLAIARCDHDGQKKADSCIFEIIGENNPDHFFVASQDLDMRKRLQEVPGVPVIFGLRNALFLEKPSEAQHGFVKSFEEKRLHMTLAEKTLLKKRTSRILGIHEQNDSNNEMKDHADGGLETSTSRKPNVVKKDSVVKDRPRFKRRKAPNPLSCLKKKTRPNVNPVSERDNNEKDGEPRSRSRKRKRSRKGKDTQHTEAEVA
ncbi:hypothetical protein MLD38_039621 [Melastoma candidum]|uniref:Uncharacterized protein n=1 Tax=Melastoma candidum TaxID=119954 RepID=A0ACB9L3U3_9MYRT|nr:hypothetical protein MLD38_039621 [Melastoma candidum]